MKFYRGVPNKNIKGLQIWTEETQKTINDKKAHLKYLQIKSYVDRTEYK
jgi:hypothetical protein